MPPPARRVAYVAPSEEEIANGAVLKCPGCPGGRLWPIRLCIPRLHCCINCARERWRSEWADRQGTRWSKYKLTKSELRRMLAAQRGRCLICPTMIFFEQKPIAQVDHNHSTGGVRGLLCARCNKGLGFFDDNPVRLIDAANYLKQQGGGRPVNSPRPIRTSTHPMRSFVTRTKVKVNLATQQERDTALHDPFLRDELEFELITRLENRPLSKDEAALLDTVQRWRGVMLEPVSRRNPRPPTGAPFVSKKYGEVSLLTDEGRELLRADVDLRAEVDEFLGSVSEGSDSPRRAPRVPEERHDPNESIDSIVSRMGTEVIDMPLLPAKKA